MNDKSQFVTLDELGNGKLPDRLITSINQTDVSIEELLDWERSKPEFYAAITNGRLRISIRKEYSTKKLLAAIASIVGVAWSIIQFVVPHLV